MAFIVKRHNKTICILHHLEMDSRECGIRSRDFIPNVGAKGIRKTLGTAIALRILETPV
ncbi:MAG: hypothetical protein LBJ67_02405 [Planctomycetaceae bacterium]|jgi:hypothetical protein|nr:hypothetical protein [Planctomycetaceae bacterium]